MHLPWSHLPGRRFLLVLAAAAALAGCGLRHEAPLAGAPVRNDPVSGTSARIYGRTRVEGPVTKETAPARARETISQNAAVLKGTARNDELFRFVAGSPKQLVLDGVTPVAGADGKDAAYTVAFHQEERGMRVENTRVFATIGIDGAVTNLGADAFPDLAIGPPAVDVAIDVAAEHGYPNTSLAKIAVRADPLDHAIRR